nr:unnamed protein product [Digitaria exilis]
MASIPTSSSPFKIILGSSSPARREILADMGYEFTVMVMVSKGTIRERPRSAEEAREFIKGYSDDRAFAVNFVLVTNLSTGTTKGGWDIPEIKFHHIPDEFIDRVVNQGDMTCVAGGLKLTHPSVLPFIKELVGTADSVRGLPRKLTKELIREEEEKSLRRRGPSNKQLRSQLDDSSSSPHPAAAFHPRLPGSCRRAAMEDDDEFGDLYTDILIPTQTPASTSAPSNAAPVETLPRPPPNPNPTPVAAAAPPSAEDDDDWLLGGSDPIPGVDPTGDWADEDDDGGAPAPPGKREAAAPMKPPPAADDLDPLMGGGVGDSGPAIPGLSSAAAAGAAGSEDWDSDSEDDIQIVLNETDGRRGLGEDEGDDEDGEDLVIVADGPHIPGMEEQDWGEDPAAAGAEGERKDGGEPGKAVAAPGGRIGYSGGGPGFHPQHHSMFKDQLRLESTMQSRIRVYESGRSEQDYDPDLPPELAAATGHPDISVDNRNRTDNGHTDFSAQGRGPANVRTPVMIGRPIQVETMYTDRFASVDTRPHRMRESDSVIEIVCQGRDSMDDETVDQTEKDSQGGNKRAHDVEEGKPYPSDKINNSGHNSNSGIKTEQKRHLPVSSESDMLSTDVNAHSPPSYKTRGSPRGARRPRRENPVEGPETKGDSEGSLVAGDDVADKLSTEDHFDDDDDRLALVDSAEVDGDDATSDQPSDTNEDDNLGHSGKKQKPTSMVEEPAGNNSSEPDEVRTSENSKGRSGSSKDQQKRLESGEEVLQDRHSRRVNDVRRHHDVEERNLRRKDEYSRDGKPDLERPHLPSRGREDIHQSYANRDRVDIRSRSYDRVRETEVWPRREDSVHSRRGKEEDLRQEYNVEVGARHRNKVRPIDRNEREEDIHPRKRTDDGDWRGSRQRERGDVVLNRRESLDDSHIKRNKDDENLRRMKPENEDMMHGYRARDDNNRRKRERDDGVDKKRRDDGGRMREKVDDRFLNKYPSAFPEAVFRGRPGALNRWAEGFRLA